MTQARDAAGRFTAGPGGVGGSGITITRIRWNEIAALRAADDGTNEGLITAAQVVLEAANQIVPYDTGHLMGSGVFDYDKGAKQASVYYDTVYAAKLHQNPQFHFQNGRRGRFLQSAMNGSKSRVLEMFDKALKVRFSKRGVP